MKNAWQITLLIAFALAIPYIGSGCSMGTSGKLGNTAVIRPDGSGHMTIWMGGTKPRVEEQAGGSVTGFYSFVDYHQDDATYDVRARITATGPPRASVGDPTLDADGFSATYNDYQGHRGAGRRRPGLRADHSHAHPEGGRQPARGHPGPAELKPENG
jgi:hypothetical protein